MYVRNASSGVWERPDFDGIDYSDGEEREAQLLAALRQCRDVSSASPELRAHVTDWPSEYHLSPVRHNLLRPFSFRATDRILELGSGCGAMTRFLGESGAVVLAVEGSRRRAQIGAERCRDLPNVRVACDNLASFQTGEKFDAVTLIGVLEYSRRFIDAADPVLECLRRARSWLADGGMLILAIENQLGLKYFAGCAEDHLDLPYAGIEGLYGERTAVTFGRRELAELLARAGLASQEWHFPFPDYKLPSVVVGESALSAAQLDLPSLLFRTRSQDYRGNRLRAFDESLARRPAWKNGLLGDMANSFLVIARAGSTQARPARELASAFNFSRHPEYCTTTRFDLKDDGGIRVSRSYASAGKARHAPGAKFTHRLVEEDYVSGPLLIESLHALARSGWSMEALAQWAEPWVSLLNSSQTSTGSRLLPPQFVDCTPFNCIQAVPGKLVYIDAEWSAAEPVPLSWIFVRGLAYSFGDCLQPGQEDTDRRSIVVALGKRFGIELAAADFALAEKWEMEFQAHCRPVVPGLPVLAPMLEIAPGGNLALFGALADAERETERMKNSRSWRLTRPLRSGLDLLRRLRALVSR